MQEDDSKNSSVETWAYGMIINRRRMHMIIEHWGKKSPTCPVTREMQINQH